MAPGRTLATMFLTTASDDDTADDGCTSVSRSDAFMMTPDDDAGDERGRGTVAYRPTDTPLVDNVAVDVEDETSSQSEPVQRDSDGGHND